MKTDIITNIRTKHWRIDLDDTDYMINSIKAFKKEYRVDRVIILKDLYYKEYVVTIYFQKPCTRVQYIDVTDDFKNLI